ncbi:MAG: metallophosphoesterase [Rhodocyclaceae bacterium]|nr:metallophosphoesterase [Rhodocyclaceae bacterium]
MVVRECCDTDARASSSDRANPLWFAGDVHGKFGHVLRQLEKTSLDARPSAIIFLGDLEPQEPLTRIFGWFIDAGVQPYFIHGNHDSDHGGTWRYIVDCWERNLHGRVTEMFGIKVAGLGGIFRSDIWLPPTRPRYQSYDDYTRATELTALRCMHSSSIFPDVVCALSQQHADILVTHEAPSCNSLGYLAITNLAVALGVKSVFNGHHHRDIAYQSNYPFAGYQVGFRGLRDSHGTIIKSGGYG